MGSAARCLQRWLSALAARAVRQLRLFSFRWRLPASRIAVREFFQTKLYARRVLLACLALAALWRVPFLLKPSASQDNLLRYVWDGRIQRLGYNPSTALPADPGLAALHTPETRGLNNPDVPSPYPPARSFSSGPSLRLKNRRLRSRWHSSCAT